MWSNEITVGRKEGMVHSQDLLILCIHNDIVNYGRYYVMIKLRIHCLHDSNTQLRILKSPNPPHITAAIQMSLTDSFPDSA